MDKVAAKSKFANVLGSKMHYIEQGEGDPILFVHGVPTSSYIWRYVFSLFKPKARLIAVDMIGFGDSGKPDIPYSAIDHLNYLTAFIESLALKNVTLVLHAWGSLPGFAYAMSHEDNIKGLAFYESYVRPTLDWSMMSLPMQELVALVNREKESGRSIDSNFFIEKLMPRAIINDFPPEEAALYKKAFAQTDDKRPLLQYLEELPSGEEPEEIASLIKDYSQKLMRSQVPKLMIYGVPGYNTTISTVAWAKEHFPNISLVDVGPILHFAQETNPEAFTNALNDWYEHIS